MPIVQGHEKTILYLFVGICFILWLKYDEKNLLQKKINCETNYTNFQVSEESSYRTYGHVHIAKTAGTSINGRLAAEFEGVCGNKGYSYDAYQFNKRLNESYGKQTNIHPTVSTGDIINKIHKTNNRGRVPFNIMTEIGFEGCQYISLEEDSKNWNKVITSLHSFLLPIELHIPCRDPLSHLMSMCNHRGHRFNCDANELNHEVEKCLMTLNRFDKKSFENNRDIELKCFAAIPVDSYLEYMSHKLTSQRVVYPYVMRKTNRDRKKENECVWNNEAVANKTREILQGISYFAWCQNCVGSKNDLLS